MRSSGIENFEFLLHDLEKDEIFFEIENNSEIKRVRFVGLPRLFEGKTISFEWKNEIQTHVLLTDENSQLQMSLVTYGAF